MKKKLSILLVLVLCLSLFGCKGGKNADTQNTEEVKTDNLIPGGEFTKEDSHWGIYKESGGSATFSLISGEMVVDIMNPGKVAHAVQINCNGFEMLQGAKYEFSCDIKSTVARKIEWRIQYDSGDYHAYVEQSGIEVGTETTKISCQFDMTEPSDPAPKLCFNIGDRNQEQGLGAHKVTIDNVCLKIVDDSNAQAVNLDVDDRDININQLGYKPDDEKIAIFRNFELDEEFTVVDAQTKEVVFTGKVVEKKRDGSSGEKVGGADFSELKTPGSYIVTAKNSGESYSFVIAEDVYNDVFVDTCKMLYLQRCGMELTEEYAGDFAHPTCHSELATIYGTDEKIDVSGGWHDAGDYGRYTVPAAKTIADLLIAYERNPEVFTDDTGIPESGNGIPDILDEARYEIDWLFKMQGPDGGVYHKVSTAAFGGIMMPEEDTAELFVSPASKTATLDFMAVMYMVERIYGKDDAALTKKCEEAAAKAYAYYLNHKNDAGFTNPEGIDTGEYPDGGSSDELLWALCEGYRATGNEAYHKLIKEFDFEEMDDGLGWITMTEYGYYAYFKADNKDANVEKKMKEAFFEYVDEAKENAFKEAYFSSILSDYPWGSNMTIANNGMLLFMAYDLTQNQDYLTAAKRQLNYLLGCNTNSYCFVTGYGGLSPKNPHHRPSQAKTKAVKGMLVGGPDSNLEDPFAKTVLSGKKKPHCYVDSDQSYSCNEITIYWNSPLICLFADVIN